MPPRQPPSGDIYSVGYNAWTGHDGLTRMFDSLEAEGVTILVDTRNSDYRARYSYDQLAQAASQRTGINGNRMMFASRPALAGKPREEAEYNAAGQADYRTMNLRPDAGQVLDGMANAAQKGERIALLCACADTCTCHRTRWLARSLTRRGVDVGHIEPGEYDSERYREEGRRELYRITRQSDLPELPAHSDTNWRERAEAWQKKGEPTPIPHNYRSPRPTRPIPADPSAVLIAGSMKANNAQLNYASALVVRAAEVGAQIHVGDNAQGVDARVVQTAASIGYDNVVVWTAGDDPRNGGVPGGQVRKVPYNPYAHGNGFTQRDRTMIRALDQERGAAFFISNGDTHYKNGRQTGTEAGYVFAIEQGKAAQKVILNRPKDRRAELQPLPTSYTPEHLPALPDEAALATDPSTVRPSFQYHPTLQEFEAGLRQHRVTAPPPPASPASDLPELPAVIPATHPERWQVARGSAAALAEQRQPDLAYHAHLHQPASMLELQTLPLVDGQGEALGYTVAGVDVHWQPTPFKVNPEKWLKASTIRVMEVAHFREAEPAEAYRNQLNQFMDRHHLDEHVAEGSDFLRAVGQLNGLNIGESTTYLIEDGVSQSADVRAEVQALRTGELPIRTWARDFHPLDQAVQTSDPKVPLHQYSLHALPTTDPDQAVNYSVVALHDVFHDKAEMGTSQVLELARFEQAGAAQEYKDGLETYVQGKPELVMRGSWETTNPTRSFLNQVAEENGLPGVEQACERVTLLQNTLLPAHLTLDNTATDIAAASPDL